MQNGDIVMHAVMGGMRECSYCYKYTLEVNTSDVLHKQILKILNLQHRPEKQTGKNKENQAQQCSIVLSNNHQCT